MQLNFELTQLAYKKDVCVHKFFVLSFYNSPSVLIQPQSDGSVKF